MGGLLMIVSMIFAAVVDFGTTAIGASEEFGLAGVVIGLTLQAGQLSALLLMRSRAIRGAMRLHVGVLAAIITAINTFFNYYALHGLLDSQPGSSVQTALRSLTPSDPDWMWNWALLALCFFVSTELEAAMLALSRMRGHLSLLGASLPLYRTPVTALASFFDGLREGGGGGEVDASPLLLAIPPLAIFLVCARALDGYSTYTILLEVIAHPGFWASIVAAYIALMAMTYQARAMILVQTRAPLGLLEVWRVAAITLLNIFCSVTFFVKWDPVAPMAFGLGLLISTLTEIIEANIVVTLLAESLGGGTVRRVTESELMRLIRRQSEAIDNAYRALGAAIGAPVRMVVRALGETVGGTPVEVVPDRDDVAQRPRVPTATEVQRQHPRQHAGASFFSHPEGGRDPGSQAREVNAG